MQTDPFFLKTESASGVTSDLPSGRKRSRKSPALSDLPDRRFLRKPSVPEPPGTRRIRRILPAAGLLLMFLFSLCFRSALPGFIPAEAAQNVVTGIHLFVSRIFHTPYHLDYYNIVEAHPFYYETFSRFKNSLVTAGAGMAICLGGAAMQTLFRNPLASPNMLGVSTGVSLGNALFVLVYTTTALSVMEKRYFYCYACSIALVLLITGGAKLLSRGGKFSIMEMLVLGSVVGQFGNVFNLYLQYHLMDQDATLMEVLQELSLGIYVLTDGMTLLLFFIGLAMGMIPLFLIRYRMNAATFPDEEARSLGVRPMTLRVTGMICGGLLAMTAMIHCGNMGILAMAIPHVCRMKIGADFRTICYHSMCIGGMLMLFCRSVGSMFFIAGAALPVNFIISVAVLPVFILALSRQRSAFE